jgi:Transposase DDE domain group 1
LQESTSQVKGSKRFSSRPRKFAVALDGEGIANHVGSLALRDLIDNLGFTEALSAALATPARPRAGYDPAEVIRDLVVMLADGGRFVSDLGSLRDQPHLFGEVASTATAWRVLAKRMGEPDLERLRAARRQARSRAWRLGAAPQEVVLDLDATLVNAHSDKESAGPNFKHGYGFHPIVCYLEETQEALAGKLRPGNAAPNHAADNIEVLELALAQLPNRASSQILLRGDSACASFALLRRARELGLRFSVSLDLFAWVREAILKTPESAWKEAINQEGEPREGAAVAELESPELRSWPSGTRAICRRERPHPGAQLRFTDANGYRFQVFITDQPDADIVQLEARHRARARAENRIRCAKDTGLENFPFHDFLPNQLWLELVLSAQDAIAFFQRLCLVGPAQRWDPKTLRYRLFHTAARIVRGGRRLILRLQRDWRWSPILHDAFHRLRRLAVAV